MTAFTVGNLSKGQTITTVNREWSSRPADQKFLSLDALLARVEHLRDTSREAIVDASQVRFLARPGDTDDLRVALPDGSEFTPSNYAFRQLCQYAGAPASYLSELPGFMAGSLLRYGLAQRPGGVKAYTQIDVDTGSRIRAITSPSYGRITDADVVRSVMRIAGSGTGDARWKVPGAFDQNAWGQRYNPDLPITLDSTTLYGSDRDVFMFLVDDRNPVEVGKLPSGEPDLMFRGLIVWNSEVGSKSLGIATMYLRGVCCNRILWGVEGFNEQIIAHNSTAPERFLTEVEPMLLSYAESGTTGLIDAVGRAKAAIVARTDEDRVDFLVRQRFSTKQAGEIIDLVETEEGYRPSSIWDFAQGITAKARTIGYADDRITFERRATTLLDRV
jgi:hypothetical protein